MTTVLLSNDEQLIAEFLTSAAFANCEVTVTSALNQELLTSCSKLFVDHKVPRSAIAPFAPVIAHLKQVETALVLMGVATSDTWQIAAVVNAQHLVLLPESKSWLIEFLKTRQTKSAKLVALFGASGGLGTSTMALTIARHLASQDQRVVLIDLDFSSMGLQIAAGADNVTGLNWTSVISEALSADPEALLAALPKWQGVHLLANDCLRSAVSSGEIHDTVTKLAEVSDFIIFDSGSWQQSANLMAELTSERFLVVGNTVRNCAIAREIFSDASSSDVQLIVREIPGSALSPLSVAQSLNRPLLKVIPTDNRICELSEQGQLLIGGNLTKLNRMVSQFCNEFLQGNELHEAA